MSLFDRIKGAGADAKPAARDPRQDFKALRETFASNHAFADDCFEKGLSVTEAKADYADVLTAEITKLIAEHKAALAVKDAALTDAGAQIAKLTADNAAVTSDAMKALLAENADIKKAVLAQGAAPVKAVASGEASSEALSQFNTLAFERSKAKGLRISDAQSQIAREQPELFAAVQRDLQARPSQPKEEPKK